MNTEELFEIGLEELTNNHFRLARKYFRKAARHGHKVAKRFLIFLYCSKDQSLARDLILCAEGRV